MRSLRKWCEEVGISEVTAWRWRKKGWIRTVNIAGRQYVSDGAHAEFQNRAENGTFSQEHKVPRK